MTSRRGFTLVELMIALILVLMVGGVTYNLLINNQRVSRAQTSQVSMQDNVRSGALILGNELREIGYDEITLASAGAAAQVPGLLPGTNSDLIAIGPDSIRYRAMRALGFTCSVDPANAEIVVRMGNVYLQRDPVPTDRLMLYVENNPNTSGDDVWLHANVTAYPGGQNCPDGTPGARVKVAFDAAAAATVLDPTHTKVGGPVRLYEVMLLRTFALNGQTWLGMRSISANTAIEPVLGPLSGGATDVDRGLRLVYRNAGGAQTALANDIRSIEVRLLGITDAPVRTKNANYATIDSLTLSTRVALRNTLRP